MTVDYMPPPEFFERAAKHCHCCPDCEVSPPGWRHARFAQTTATTGSHRHDQRPPARTNNRDQRHVREGASEMIHMLALTISISWHDVWTVGKYALCAIGGGAVVFFLVAIAISNSIGRSSW